MTDCVTFQIEDGTVYWCRQLKHRKIKDKWAITKQPFKNPYFAHFLLNQEILANLDNLNWFPQLTS